MQIAVAILVANANQGISYAKKLIKAFKERVLSYPNSIFEAEPCLVVTLTELNAIGLLKKASLVITPNAYNEGVLYDVVPNNNLGDMDVVRATTATRVNSLGLIEEVGLNVPRLDYSNGSCPSLLVEPQRTNYQTNSNLFTSWIAPSDGVTLTPNTTDTLSPSGNNDSTKMTQTGGNRRIFDVVTLPSGVSTYSLYVKSGTGSVITLLTSNLTFFLTYNLITKTITTYNGTGTITELQNGWFKITATGTQSTLEVVQIRSENNNGETLYIYGAQFEAGSYPTSYIPTVATSITRNADVISKTGISSLIGQTEGTIFLDFKLNGNSYSDNTLLYYVTLAKNSPFNFFEILRYNNSLLYFIAVNGVGVGPTVVTTFSNLSGRYKLAISYNSSGLKFFLNGSLILTNTDIVPPCDEVNFGDYDSFVNQLNNFNSIQLYKTALSDTECINLTTI